MAGVPPSFESEHRRALRMAIGVTFTFALTQVFSWPLSFIATVGTLVYLQDPRPMPLAQGLGTALTLFGAVIVGFILSVWLGDYPVLLVLVFGILLAAVYRSIMSRGGHLIVIVGLLLATTLVPVVTNLLPELGYVVVTAIGASFVLAWFVATATFTLMPALDRLPPEHGHGDAVDVTVVSVNLAIVVGTLLAFFLLFGRTDVLTLAYSAIFAMSLSQAGSAATGLTYLRANLIFAGLAVVVIFELLTVVPFLPFAIILFFLAIYIFARGFFGHGRYAAEWSSGTFGLIILLSGLLSSEKITATDKLFDRLVQIGIAALYVTFAFAVLEYIRRLRLARGTANG